MIIIGTCFSIESVPRLLFGVAHNYNVVSDDDMTIVNVGHYSIIKHYNFGGILCCGKVVYNYRFTLIIDESGDYVLIVTGKTAMNRSIKIEMEVA